MNDWDDDKIEGELVEEEQPQPKVLKTKKGKIDKRSQSSKTNIIKAREKVKNYLKMSKKIIDSNDNDSDEGDSYIDIQLKKKEPPPQQTEAIVDNTDYQTEIKRLKYELKMAKKKDNDNMIDALKKEIEDLKQIAKPITQPTPQPITTPTPAPSPIIQQPLTGFLKHQEDIANMRLKLLSRSLF